MNTRPEPHTGPGLHTEALRILDGLGAIRSGRYAVDQRIAVAQVYATLALAPAPHPLEDHRGAWTVLHLDGGATVEGHLMRFQGGYVDVRHQVTGDTTTVRMDTITRYDIPA